MIAYRHGEFKGDRKERLRFQSLPEMKNRAGHVDNLLTEDDQWRKLKLVVDTAGKVWGGT